MLDILSLETSTTIIHIFLFKLPKRNIGQDSGYIFVDFMTKKETWNEKKHGRAEHPFLHTPFGKPVSLMLHYVLYLSLKRLHLDSLWTIYLPSQVLEWAKDDNSMENKRHRSSWYISIKKMIFQREEEQQNNHTPLC